MRVEKMIKGLGVIWLMSLFVIPIGAQDHNARVIAMSSYLNMRDAPNQIAPVVAELTANTPLNALARTRDNVWYFVQLDDGRTGWVSSSYVILSDGVILPFADAEDPIAEPVTSDPPVPASDPVVPSGANAQVSNAIWSTLNMRDAPTRAGAIIAELNPGSPLIVLEQDASQTWLRVQYGDVIGWVAARYVDSVVQVPVASSPIIEPSASTSSTADMPGQTIGGDIVTIAAQGRARGNSSTNFSMVGDSITYSEMFMRPLAVSAVNLGAHGYLQEVIAHFSQGQNSFSRTSLAAGNGWTTETALNPEFASSANCLAGEAPLDCEYRMVRPAVSLIMLGSNDVVLISRDVYAHNLGLIVRKSIEQGIIPIVSTIPYRVGYESQVEAFNQTVRDVANLYNIPLWDYFGAMLALPNAGLSDDGLHPLIPNGGLANGANFTGEYLSSGYVIRNLTGLQALHDVYQRALR